MGIYESDENRAFMRAVGMLDGDERQRALSERAITEATEPRWGASVPETKTPER